MRRNRGQALLETVLTIPILLILLLGTYAAARTSFLKSRAESAAFTQTLRAGRSYRGIERELSTSMLPEEATVEILSGKNRDHRLLPAPFPSLAGSTKAAVEVRKRWNEIGAPRWMPTVKIIRQAESNVDCWGKETSSGERVRRWVKGMVLLGVIH
jgi:TadE-like protein